MYERLSVVDDFIRPDHHHLNSSDSCYFFGEYTARRGFNHSQTNQLISNFKKCVSRMHEYDFRYKRSAIETIATELHRHISPANLTFVPIPPSKAKQDPLYDDRLQRVLTRYSELSPGVDWRDIVIQSRTTRATHTTDDRLSLQELIGLYSIDQTLTPNIRDTIVIVDDVLTTGCHFKAVKATLAAEFPNKPILGIFVARRVPEAEFPNIF